MRLRLLLLLIVMIGAAAPARADQLEYPWCANFADGAGANCGFVSQEQCMMTATPGTGGTCDRNPFYRGPTEASHPRPTARKRRPPKKD